MCILVPPFFTPTKRGNAFACAGNVRSRLPLDPMTSTDRGDSSKHSMLMTSSTRRKMIAAFCARMRTGKIPCQPPGQRNFGARYLPPGSNCIRACVRRPSRRSAKGFTIPQQTKISCTMDQVALSSGEQCCKVKY